MSAHPHSRGALLTAGAAPEQARLAVIALHGRGGSAADILGLSRGSPADVHWVAPEAAGNTWYPQRFLAPLAANEPFLSSALRRLGEVVAGLREAGLGEERIAFVGFSQGACLSLEYVARNPRRYAFVGGLSGALIGPDDLVRPASVGTLSGTPILLGCSDEDFHIPAHRVERSAEELRALGADVSLRLYPGADHAVTLDELQWLRGKLAG